MKIARMSAKHFQYLVLGGGSGGIAGARRAAEFGAHVALVENKPLGGTCVNVGCVPKKIMFYASEYASRLPYHEGYGFTVTSKGFNMTALKKSRDAYISKLNDIYKANLEKSNVQLIKGLAKFSEHQGGEGHDRSIRVEVEDQVYTADHVLIATGGRPIDLKNIPGHELGVNSDGFFEMETLPKRVVLVGAGYIAVELAGILKALGSEVSLVIRKNKVLRHFDSLISDVTTQNLEESGVVLHKETQVTKVERQREENFNIQNNNQNNNTNQNETNDAKNTDIDINKDKSNQDDVLKVHLDNGTVLAGVDKLIWAVGRTPNVDLGLNHVGVRLDRSGHIEVDEYQNTSASNIYAVGDVCGKHLLTPVAIAAGRRLSHRIFNNEADSKLDYSDIPSVVFSHPPSGSVGLSQKEAEEKYGKEMIRVYSSTFAPLHYSILDHKSSCHYKLLCLLPHEKVVGLHMVGDSSDEILQGFSVAIKMGACKRDFDNTVAIHPTSAEELVTMR